MATLRCLDTNRLLLAGQALPFPEFGSFMEIEKSKKHAPCHLASKLDDSAAVYSGALDFSALDYVDLKCLEFICLNGNQGVRVRDLTDYVSLTYNPVLNRMKRLADRKFVSVKIIPHLNPGMPSGLIYYAVPALDLHVVQKAMEHSSICLLRSNMSDSSSDKSANGLAKEKTDFAKRIEDVRPSSRQAHLQLVRLAVEHGSLTMIVGAKLTSRRTQTVHSQLVRLAGIHILDREKQKLENGSTEFVYVLSADLDPADVLSYPFDEMDGSSAVIDTTTFLTLPHHHQSLPTHSDIQMSLFPWSDKASITPAELHKLMASFDPTWPDEWKATWFAGLKRIIGHNE
jgi:hypothetical protein